MEENNLITGEDHLYRPRCFFKNPGKSKEKKNQNKNRFKSTEIFEALNFKNGNILKFVSCRSEIEVN